MKSFTIIDDNTVDCLLLTNWLNQNNQYKVIHQYYSGIDVLKHYHTPQSDYCIIDVQMPLLSGIDTTILLFSRGYKGKILLVSHAYSHNFRIKSIEVGAHGYCRKDRESIIKSILDIEKGVLNFDEILYKDWQEYSERYSLSNKDTDQKIDLLNPHHRKILLYSCKGYTTKQMSDLMSLKKHTIEQYRAAMLQRLGFNTIAQAIAWAVATHIINHSEVFAPTES